MANALLPDSVAELVELIGHAKARALVDGLGGARFRFDGPLREVVIGLVGPDAHAVLAAHYGGEQVELARCGQLLRALKMAEALAALRRGATTNTVALANSVTGRTIRNWKRAAAAVDDGQLDLFNQP